jgi:hypothetical protein
MHTQIGFPTRGSAESLRRSTASLPKVSLRVQTILLIKGFYLSFSLEQFHGVSATITASSSLANYHCDGANHYGDIMCVLKLYICMFTSYTNTTLVVLYKRLVLGEEQRTLPKDRHSDSDERLGPIKPRRETGGSAQI